MWTIIKYYITSINPWLVLLILSGLSFFDTANSEDVNYVQFMFFTIYSYFYIYVGSKRSAKLRIVTSYLPLSELKIWIAKSVSFLLLLLMQLSVVLLIDKIIFSGFLNFVDHYLAVAINGYFFAFVLSRYQIRKSRNRKQKVKSILIAFAMPILFIICLVLSFSFYSMNKIETLNLWVWASMLMPLLIINSFDYFTYKMIR